MKLLTVAVALLAALGALSQAPAQSMLANLDWTKETNRDAAYNAEFARHKYVYDLLKLELRVAAITLQDELKAADQLPSPQREQAKARATGNKVRGPFSRPEQRGQDWTV
jgi:hypothetical protein